MKSWLPVRFSTRLRGLSFVISCCWGLFAFAVLFWDGFVLVMCKWSLECRELESLGVVHSSPSSSLLLSSSSMQSPHS